jgi:hypothetical protein
MTSKPAVRSPRGHRSGTGVSSADVLSLSLRNAASLLMSGLGSSHELAAAEPNHHHHQTAALRPATAGNCRPRPTAPIAPGGVGGERDGRAARPSSAYHRFTAAASAFERGYGSSALSRTARAVPEIVRSEEPAATNDLLSRCSRLDREATELLLRHDFCSANRRLSTLAAVVIPGLHYSGGSNTTGQAVVAHPDGRSGISDALFLKFASSMVNYTVTLAVSGETRTAVSLTEEVIRRMLHASSSSSSTSSTAAASGCGREEEEQHPRSGALPSRALILQAAQHNLMYFKRRLDHALEAHDESSLDVFRCCFSFLPSEVGVSSRGFSETDSHDVQSAKIGVSLGLSTAVDNICPKAAPRGVIVDLPVFLTSLALGTAPRHLRRAFKHNSSEVTSSLFSEMSDSHHVNDATRLILLCMQLHLQLVGDHSVVAPTACSNLSEESSCEEIRSFVHRIAVDVSSTGSIRFLLPGVEGPVRIAGRRSSTGVAAVANALCEIIKSHALLPKGRHTAVDERLAIFDSLSKSWVSALVRGAPSTDYSALLQHPALLLACVSSPQHSPSSPRSSSLLHKTPGFSMWHSQLRAVRQLFRIAKENFASSSGLAKLRLLVSRQNALKELGYYYSTALSSAATASAGAVELMLRAREIGVQGERAYDGGAFGGVSADVIGDALRAGVKELLRPEPLVALPDSTWIAFAGLLCHALLEGRSYNLQIPLALWLCICHPDGHHFQNSARLIPTSILWEAASVIDPDLTRHYHMQLSSSASSRQLLSVAELTSYLSRAAVARATYFSSSLSTNTSTSSVAAVDETTLRDCLVEELVAALVIGRRRKILTLVRQYFELFSQVVDDSSAHVLLFGRHKVVCQSSSTTTAASSTTCLSFGDCFAPLDLGDVAAIGIAESIQGTISSAVDDIAAAEIVALLEFRDWDSPPQDTPSASLVSAPRDETPTYLCQWLHTVGPAERRLFLRLCCGMDTIPRHVQLNDAAVVSGSTASPSARIVVQHRRPTEVWCSKGHQDSNLSFHASALSIYAQTCFFTLFLPSFASFASFSEAMGVALVVMGQDPSMAEAGSQ